MRTACRVAEGAALGAMLEARCPIEEVAAELRFRGGGGGGVGAALGERPQVGPAGGAATIERGGGLRGKLRLATARSGIACRSKGLRCIAARAGDDCYRPNEYLQVVANTSRARRTTRLPYG